MEDVGDAEGSWAIEVGRGTVAGGEHGWGSTGGDVEAAGGEAGLYGGDTPEQR